MNQPYCVWCGMPRSGCVCEDNESSMIEDGLLNDILTLCEDIVHTFELECIFIQEESAHLETAQKNIKMLFPFVAHEIKEIARHHTDSIVPKLTISNEDLKNYLSSCVWD